MKTIVIRPEQYQMMKLYVQSIYPQEACGLLDGLNRALSTFYPIRNCLQSTTGFMMEPMEQLAAMQKIDSLGKEIVAIVHSHPTGPRYPSETDLKENYYPGVDYLIWSFNGVDWQLAAFALEKETYSELQVIIGVILNRG